MFARCEALKGSTLALGFWACLCRLAWTWWGRTSMYLVCFSKRAP